LPGDERSEKSAPPEAVGAIPADAGGFAVAVAVVVAVALAAGGVVAVAGAAGAVAAVFTDAAGASAVFAGVHAAIATQSEAPRSARKEAETGLNRPTCGHGWRSMGRMEPAA